MARVIRQTEQGGLYFSGGRFHYVEDDTAKAQLLREHAHLKQGDDPLRRLAGVALDALLRARASPFAVAAAYAEELARDTLVRTVTAVPIGSGFTESYITPTKTQRAYSIKVFATLKTNAQISFSLEVPLGP